MTASLGGDFERRLPGPSLRRAEAPRLVLPPREPLQHLLLGTFSKQITCHVCVTSEKTDVAEAQNRLVAKRCAPEPVQQRARVRMFDALCVREHTEVYTVELTCVRIFEILRDVLF